jgi:hypothetical protein
MGPVSSFMAKLKVKGKKSGRKEKKRDLHFSNRISLLGPQGAYSSILSGRMFSGSKGVLGCSYDVFKVRRSRHGSCPSGAWNLGFMVMGF